MAAAELVLTEPVVPTSDTTPTNPRGRLTEHPKFCHVCLNLSVDVAEECHGLRDNLYSYGATWEFNSPLAEVLEARNSGCASCQLIVLAIDGVVPYHPNWNPEYCEDRELWIKMQHSVVLNLSILGEISVDVYSTKASRGVLPWQTIGTRVETSSGTSDTYPWVGGDARDVQPHSSSSSCLSLIREWIEQCKSHEHCTAAQSSLLPRRVVTVGHEADFCDVQLLETTQQEGVYLALSHCWGATVPLKLLSSNIDEHKKRIPWQELSRTFQNAVAICRNLGYDYIWIDSLCIIQDSAEDWREQSAVMGNIYQNAFFTISATKGSDGSSGCFGPRQSSCVIKGVDHAGHSFKVHAREPIDHSAHTWGIPGTNNAATESAVDSTPNVTDETLEQNPLLTRAWCYQERLLSPRIIHFEGSEIVWECRTCINCECGAMSDHRNDKALAFRQLAVGMNIFSSPITNAEELRFRKLAESHLHPYYWNLSLEELKKNVRGFRNGGMHYGNLCRLPGDAATLASKFLEEEPDSMEDVMLTGWKSIVALYSFQHLTFESDALVALAGLANRWHSILGGQYLAGIWKEDLVRSLGWKAEGPERPTAAYLAPTWSWVSARRPVKWQIGSENILSHVEILETVCQVDSAAPFGRVEQGHLVLTANLIRGVLKLPQENGPAAISVPGIHTLGAGSAFHLDRSDRLSNLGDNTIFCMRLCKEWMSRLEQSYLERCLVLSCVNEMEQTYQRIGFMTLEQPVESWDSVSIRQTIKLV